MFYDQIKLIELHQIFVLDRIKTKVTSMVILLYENCICKPIFWK